MRSVIPVPVTVVVPTYNRPGFLSEALESVRRQTLRPAEIIVVDDGSTVPLGDLPGARVIRQANAGPSVARNTGIAAARTEWIALLDDDDLWEPEKLELQWEAVRRYPDVGIVFTDWLTFSNEEIFSTSMLTAESDRIVTPHHEEIRAAYRIAGRSDDGDTSYQDNARFSAGLIRYGPFVCTPSVIFRREAAIACGGFDPIMPRTHDWDFWLRLAGGGAAAAGIERPLVRCRSHSDNVSRDYVDAARWIAFMAQKAHDGVGVYPSGMNEFWSEALPFYIHRAAREAMRTGRFRDFRDLYACLLRYRRMPSAYGGMAVANVLDTRLGHICYQSARRLKRTIGSLSPLRPKLNGLRASRTPSK